MGEIEKNFACCTIFCTKKHKVAGATERRGKARVNGTGSGGFRPSAHLPPSCHPKTTSIKLLPVYVYMYVKKKLKSISPVRN